MEFLAQTNYTEDKYWSRAEILRMLRITGMTFRSWTMGTRRVKPLPVVRVRTSMATKEVRVLIRKEDFLDWLKAWKPVYYEKLCGKVDDVHGKSG